MANLGGSSTLLGDSTLDLDNGASKQDAALDNTVWLEFRRMLCLSHLGITNSGTLESTGGLLTIDAGSTIVNSGTLQANGGELDLSNEIGRASCRERV